MAASSVTQNATMDRDLSPVESTGHETREGEEVLGSQFTDGLIYQNRQTVPQQDTVVIPVSSGGRPANPQSPAVTERRH